MAAFCGQCGVALPDLVRFCPGCGAEVVNSPTAGPASGTSTASSTPRSLSAGGVWQPDRNAMAAAAPTTSAPTTSAPPHPPAVSVSKRRSLVVVVTAVVAITVIAAGAVVARKLLGGNSSIPASAKAGTSLTLTPQPGPGSAGLATPAKIAATVADLQRRLTSLGVSGASVTSHGSGATTTIVVTASATGLQGLLTQAAVTGQVGFRPILLSGPPTPLVDTSPMASGNGRSATGLKSASPSQTPLATSSSVIPATVIPTAAQKAFDSLDCTKEVVPGRRPADTPTEILVTCATNGAEKYILGPQLIPGTDLTGANASLLTTSQGATTGEWVVNLTFNGAATSKFAQITHDMFAQTNGSDANRFAIVLDAQVISAPTVNGVISDGRPQISGSFTRQSAQALAAVLTQGALPVPLRASTR